MLNSQMRAWMEIDIDAVRFNFNQIKNNTNSKICCVIKADAYGHGSVELAKEYEKLGASFFAVSNIQEAIKLRENGITLPILNLGYTPPIYVGVLNNENISQCVYSYEYAKALENECSKQDVKIKIHIKIDTGMSRLGFYFQDSTRDIDTINEILTVCEFEHFEKEGIFTHFAVSDEGENDFTCKQLYLFEFLVSKLDSVKFQVIHCANSAGILDYKNSHFDMVRAGIVLYGLEPSNQIENHLNLKPVLSLKSIVSHVKTIEKGSTVSYGRKFVADKTLKIATVPIGYADGYTRILADNNTEVLIKGKRKPIIGKICMDQLMVLLDDNDDVQVGDTVVLIGENGNEFISANEIAQKRHSINYEVVCDLSLRVPRVFINL